MSANPPRIVVCRQDADFSFLHGTSAEEDPYAVLEAFYGTREEVAEPAQGRVGSSTPLLATAILGSKAKKVGYIGWIETVERQKGIARGMLEKALDKLFKEGVGEVFLVAVPDARKISFSALTRFYRSVGFEHWREDNAIMRAKLPWKKIEEEEVEQNPGDPWRPKDDSCTFFHHPTGKIKTVKEERQDPGYSAHGKLYTSHHRTGKHLPRRSGLYTETYERADSAIYKSVFEANEQVKLDYELYNLLGAWVNAGISYHKLNDLVKLKDERYDLLRAITEPIRTALKERYGKTVKLYRSQQRKIDPKNKRYLLSFGTHSTHRYWGRGDEYADTDFYVVDVPIDKILFVFGSNFFDHPVIYDEFVVEADVIEGAKPIKGRTYN